jgi:hypothetical protein
MDNNCSIVSWISEHSRFLISFLIGFSATWVVMNLIRKLLRSRTGSNRQDSTKRNTTTQVPQELDSKPTLSSSQRTNNR